MSPWANFLLAAAAFALVGIVPGSSRADFLDGWAAYDRGDRVGAFREWHRLAERGDPRAQTNIGIMYQRGEGVPSHFVEAERWLTKAADQGFAPAQRKLAYRYFTERGFADKDYVKALHWYVILARHGDSMAMQYLGLIHQNGGSGVSRNLVEAYAWHAVSSAFGSGQARGIRDRIA